MMNAKQFFLSIVVVLSAAVFLATGEDVETSGVEVEAEAATSVEDKQLLDELSQIRQKMGGGILHGSILDTKDAEAIFQEGLQSLMNRNDVISVESMQSAGDVPWTTPEGKITPAGVDQDLVTTLREQSILLDRVANEIEPLRQYQNADALRESANRLRKLARRYDAR